MSTTKLLIGTAALLAAASVGTAVFETGAARRATTALEVTRSELKVAQAQAAVGRKELEAAKQSAAAASARVAALEKEIEAARKKAVAAGTSETGSPRPASMNPWSNPDYARVYVEKYRAELQLKYAPLYRALGLSAGQIAEFEAALTENMQAVTEIWGAASAQGIDSGRDSAAATAVAKMTSDPAKVRDEKLKALLGDAGFAQFERFNAPDAQAVRDLVTSLAANLYASDTPLMGSQGERLTEIIARNTRMVNTPMASDGGKPMYRVTTETDWAKVSAQVQGLLAEPQIAVLKDLTEQKRLYEALLQISATGQLPAGSK